MDLTFNKTPVFVYLRWRAATWSAPPAPAATLETPRQRWRWTEPCSAGPRLRRRRPPAGWGCSPCWRRASPPRGSWLPEMEKTCRTRLCRFVYRRQHDAHHISSTDWQLWGTVVLVTVNILLHESKTIRAGVFICGLWWKTTSSWDCKSRIFSLKKKNTYLIFTRKILRYSLI